MSASNLADPVRAATLRAKITAVLNNMEQRTVFTKELLQALEPTITELGLSKAGAYYHIKAMGDNGLIHMEETTSGRKLYGPKSGGGQEVGPSPKPPQKSRKARAKKRQIVEIPPIEPAQIPNKHMHHVPTNPQVMELEVAGVTLIVGRNPVTGRPRIVIEG